MWIWRSSLFALFFALLAAFWALDVPKKITPSFEALLPQSEAKEKLLIYRELSRGVEVVIAANTTQMEAIRGQILAMPQFAPLYPSENLKEFWREYRFFLSPAPQNLPNAEQVRGKLSQIKQSLINGFAYSPDSADPLSLFAPQKRAVSAPEIDGFDETFVFRLSISPSDYEAVYDKLNQIAEGAFVFSPFFYQVENTRAFKSQAVFILTLSGVILALLYIWWLKSPLLLLCSFVTISSSVTFAQIASAAIWDEVSLISLIFSAAVSSVSIDYMFHSYLHDMYGSKKGFSKAVFLGFITTFAAFCALGITKFTLISQIALTSAFSLAFAYISFVFLYPRLGFAPARSCGLKIKRKAIFSPLFICVFSAMLLCGSVFWTRFNFDIKSLDVKNEALSHKEQMVNFGGKSAALLSADTIDALIKIAQNSELYAPIGSLVAADEFEQKKRALSKLDFARLRADIAQEAHKLGFKKGYFDEAYKSGFLNPPTPKYSEEFLSEPFLRAVNSGGKFYAGAIYRGDLNISSPNITPISSISLFSQELKNAETNLIAAAVFILILIVCVLAYAAKREFLSALGFVLLPLGISSCVFLFTQANILHIFTLVIVASFSVDYGIYLVCERNEKTNEAVLYSLLSTFAGFGVLSFSSIGALRSIGIIALCAVAAIGFLLCFLKAKDETDSAK